MIHCVTSIEKENNLHYNDSIMLGPEIIIYTALLFFVYMLPMRM